MFILGFLLALANRGVQLKGVELGGGGCGVGGAAWCRGNVSPQNKTLADFRATRHPVIHAFKGCSDIPACLVLRKKKTPTTTPSHLLRCLYCGPQDTAVSEEAGIVKPLFSSALEQTWDQHFLSCGR